MSSPRLVIHIELRRGQLDAQEWASARRIVRWRLQDGVDGFLAAALPCERRSQVEATAEAEVRE